MLYDKELLSAIKEELLECFDAEYNGKEIALNELRRYKNEFRNVEDYNIYRYGNIRPYYSQIRDLFVSKGIESIPKDDNETLCGLFCKYIRRATDELLKE